LQDRANPRSAATCQISPLSVWKLEMWAYGCRNHQNLEFCTPVCQVCVFYQKNKQLNNNLMLLLVSYSMLMFTFEFISLNFRAWSICWNRNRFQFQWNRLLHKWNWNRIRESGENIPDHCFAVETESKDGGFHLVTYPGICFFENIKVFTNPRISALPGTECFTNSVA